MPEATHPAARARRHPGRRALRASLAVRRHLSAAAHRGPCRRPRARRAAAPARHRRAHDRQRGRHVAHRGVQLPRSRGPGGPAGVAGQLRAGVPGGDGGARRRCWGTWARAVPSTGSRRSGSPDVHVAIAVLSPDAARLEAAAEKARRAHTELPGLEVVWRQDCYQLATGRTSFGFKDGIGQPAVEGSGRPSTNPRERPLKAGEIILGYPDETGELPPMPTPEVLGRNGTYVVFRKLHTKVAAYRRYLRDRAASREEEDLLGAKMVGRWQSGAPLALAPDRDDPDLGADARRNNDFAFADDPRGFKCPVGAHARRANPRDALDQDGSVDVRLHRMIRRGTSYGPALPAGRARGRRRRPRDRLRVRRGAPQAPVRVRQDPVAQRRHLHRGPAREGPPRRTERRVERLHHPPAARSGAGCRTCRRSW